MSDSTAADSAPTGSNSVQQEQGQGQEQEQEQEQKRRSETVSDREEQEEKLRSETETTGGKMALPREDMVTTAVRFLENPKVSSSSDSVKRAFLTKKGLTPEEIDMAFQRARPTLPAALPQQTVVPNGPQSPSTTLMVPYYSRWHQIRDLINFIVILSGAAYGIRYLWQRYLRSWLYGPPVSPAKKSLQQLSLEMQVKVQDSLQALDNSVQKLHIVLEAQTARVEGLVQQEGRQDKRDSAELGDLKRDIQSVKGILLSSSRFPTNPTIQAPSIPAWQRNSSVSNSSNITSSAADKVPSSPGSGSGSSSEASEGSRGGPDLLLKSGEAIPIATQKPPSTEAKLTEVLAGGASPPSSTTESLSPHGSPEVDSGNGNVGGEGRDLTSGSSIELI